MDYSKFKETFIKQARTRSEKERQDILNSLGRLVDVLDDVAGEALTFVEGLHSSISREVEDLAAQLEDGPVASSKDCSKMYEYIKSNGTQTMKTLLSMVPAEYFIEKNSTVIKKWYDSLIEDQMEGFDWDGLTDEGEKEE